jgi:drug/metabolite transporter (DMT)-like permease
VRIHLLLALAASLAAAAQLMFKFGATGRTGWMSFINAWIIAGLVCYGLGTVIWIYGLSKAPLSVVYPFTALTFVLVYAASVLVVGETTSARSLIGIALILGGLYCVSGRA